MQKDKPSKSKVKCDITRKIEDIDTILLADENEEIRIVLTDLLKRIGDYVLTAENVIDVIDLFKQVGDEIDLIILDIYAKNGWN